MRIFTKFEKSAKKDYWSFLTLLRSVRAASVFKNRILWKQNFSRSIYYFENSGESETISNYRSGYVFPTSEKIKLGQPEIFEFVPLTAKVDPDEFSVGGADLCLERRALQVCLGAKVLAHFNKNFYLIHCFSLISSRNYRSAKSEGFLLDANCCLDVSTNQKAIFRITW